MAGVLSVRSVTAKVGLAVGLTGAFVVWSSDFVGGWASARFRTKPSPPAGSMVGRVVVVTGGNAGIGFRTVAALAEAGATVVLCCRSLHKGHAARATLSAGHSVEVMELDLASVASVRRFAEAFRERFPRLDVLVLNAGVAGSMTGSEGFGLTADGFEEMIGTNFLGHFYLTTLLLPTLRAAAAPRVIALTSIAAANCYARGIDPSTWRARAPDFKDWAQYGQSKLALLLFVQQLQSREPRLCCVACHPGVVAGTALVRPSAGLVECFLTSFIFSAFAMREADGHCCPVYLASTSGELRPGGFYFPVGRLVSWPMSFASVAYQRLGALQLPVCLQNEHPALWEDATAALSAAGAKF